MRFNSSSFHFKHSTHFFLYHVGISCSMMSGLVELISSFEKSNRSGKGLPFGNLVFLSLNSSKNGCNNTSKGLSLLSGLYTKTLDIKSIASGGVLDLKTLFQG
jgi:hypothetical protein